jgi:hypothetical protein
MPRNKIHQFINKHLLLLLILSCSIVFFTTAFIYAQLSSPPSGDEPHYLIISQTLLKYHNLNVMLDYSHGDYRAFYPYNIDPHLSHGANGQLLPLHSIGAPLLWLLPFYLLGRLGAVFFISLLSVLIILNIYKFLITMNIGAKYAFVVCLAYAIASPLYMYSHLTFIEPVGALICIYVLRKIFQNELSLSGLLVSSLLLGILPWVHIRFAFFELVLFFALLYKIYAHHQLKHFKYYACLFLPVTMLFITYELYTYKFWATFNPAAIEINDIHNHSMPFVISPLTGIVGTFLDQQYGFLINFPIFLLLFPGIVLAIKNKYARYNLLMLLLTVPYILLFSSFKNWTGGWSPPARLIFVLLPLLSFYPAYALEQISTLFSQLVLAAAILYGLSYNLLSLTPPLNSFNSPTGYNRTIMHLQLFNYRLTDLFPSIFLANQTGLFALWIIIFSGLSCTLLLSKRLKRWSGASQDHH